MALTKDWMDPKTDWAPGDGITNDDVDQFGNNLWYLKERGNLKIDTVDPTATDDADAGYVVGKSWFNSTTDTFFKLIDSTVGAAVWKPYADTAQIEQNAIDIAQNTVDIDQNTSELEQLRIRMLHGLRW